MKKIKTPLMITMLILMVLFNVVKINHVERITIENNNTVIHRDTLLQIRIFTKEVYHDKNK